MTDDKIREELRFKILHDVLRELSQNDKEVKRSVLQAQLFAQHPTLEALTKKYAPQELHSNIDKDKLADEAKASLRRRCEDALSGLTGRDDTSSMSHRQLVDLLSSETKKLGGELEQMQKTDNEIAHLSEKLVKAHQLYMTKAKRYCEEYLIDFKLPFDDNQVNFLCARTQVQCFKNKMHETEAAMNKYGSEALIKKQKERKRDLDKASALLDTELQAVRAEVAKFESLDADLVRQYLKIQQELGFSKYVAENFNERLGSSSATEDESLGKLNLSDEDPHSPL